MAELRQMHLVAEHCRRLEMYKRGGHPVGLLTRPDRLVGRSLTFCSSGSCDDNDDGVDWETLMKMTDGVDWETLMEESSSSFFLIFSSILQIK